MKILRTKHDLKEAINKIRNLGFVPTMGSIHNGHISLIKKSKLKCDKTLVNYDLLLAVVESCHYQRRTQCGEQSNPPALLQNQAGPFGEQGQYQRRFQLK